MSEVIYMNYSEIRERQREHYLVTREIPIPSYISLPIPTKRLSFPAYAYFASPAVNVYDQPFYIYPPDRWWALRAQGGHLLLYAQTRVLPFAKGMIWNEVTLPEETGSIPELDKELSHIEQLMDQVIEAFFSDQSREREIRQQLRNNLLNYIPMPLHSWYRALAPDFFAWLEA